MASNHLIIDGHNDSLMKIYLKEHGDDFSFFKLNENGHIDLERAKKGNMIGGFFAIFTPYHKASLESDPYYGLKMYDNGYEKYPGPVEHEYAKEYTKNVLNLSHELEIESNGQFQIIRSYSQLEQNIKNNIFSAILHIEGAESIEEDFKNLESFYEKGLRSLGPVWSRSNIFGHGVPFKYPFSPDTGPGLTNAGKNLIKSCNELGIIVDLAHINEKGFFDVAKISRCPLVVSHAGVHALCPSTRNLTDNQIDAVASSNGVIGIIFESTNINTKNGFKNTNLSIDEVVKHIDYIVKRAGEDHVAFGSDFDGADLIDDLKDVSKYPNLINALKKIGYEDSVIEKIAHKNWLRVIKDTWKFS